MPGVQPVLRTIGGVAVKSTPLDPFRTLDLIPEITGLIGDTSGAKTDVDVFLKATKNLGGGKLRTLLPQILAGTSMPVEGGAYLPMNTVEHINMCFDGKMAMLPEVIAFAMEVSFSDFLAGLASVAKQFKERGNSVVSSPNT